MYKTVSSGELQEENLAALSKAIRREQQFVQSRAAGRSCDQSTARNYCPEHEEYRVRMLGFMLPLRHTISVVSVVAVH